MEADDNRGNEAVAMIAKLISNDNKRFKLLLNYISWRYKIYDILTRQEREGLELELDNHGKTYREISKVARIVACNIEIISNKIIEKKAEESKEDKIIFSPRTLIKKHEQYLLLNSLLMCCGKERREIENIYNETAKTRIYCNRN